MTQIVDLENGVRVVCEERPGSHKVNFNVVFKKGSASESAEKKGLLNLTAKAMLGGTAELPREALAEEIENLGAQYGVSVGREFTFIGADCLAKDIDCVFDLTSSMLLHPKFDPEEIEKERNEILQSLQQRSQKSLNVAQDGFFTMLAGEAGHLPMGCKKTVESFVREDLVAEHEALLHTPNEIVVSFVGDIKLSRARELVEHYFGRLENINPKLANQNFLFCGGDVREVNENEQLNIFLGLKAPSRHNLDRYTHRVLTEIISGGMSSPLFVEVREKRGLVYSIDANYLAFDKMGVFYIYAGTSAGQVGELLDVSFDVLENILRDGVCKKDIAAAKERIVRELIYKSENAENVCERNAVSAHHYGVIGSADELKFYLDQVSEVHLKQAVYDLFDTNSYILSNAGPQEKMPSPEQIKKKLQDRCENYVRLNAASIELATPEQEAKFLYAHRYQQMQSKPDVTVLANDLTIVSQARSGTLSMGAWVRVGSDHEEENINGITHMIEHMMFKGTKTYAAGDIDYAVEMGMGGDLNAYTSRDQTAYFFYSLMPEHLDETVKICSEMVFEARLDHDEFDGISEIQEDGSVQKFKGERDVVIEEIKMYDDDVHSLRHDLIYQTAYPQQPHGRTILGPEANIREMTADDLKNYRDRFYAPNNVVFSAIGPIDHQDFVAAVKKYCNTFETTQKTKLPKPSYHGGVVAKKNAQACVNSISFFVEACKFGEPESYSWQALSELLTGGFSSRLHKKIVNDRHLAPRVSSSYIQYSHNGGFVISSGLPVEKTEEFLTIIYQELRDLAQNLSEKELQKIKSQLEMANLSKMETNVDLCVEYGESSLVLDRPLEQEEIYQDIQKISVQSVKQLANVVLETRPSIAMIVPESANLNDLPDEGKVLELREQSKKTL